MSLRDVGVRGILGRLDKPLARKRGTPGLALLGLILLLAVGAPAAAVDCLDVECPDSGGGCGCGGGGEVIFPPPPETALDVTFNPLIAQSSHHTTAVEQTGWGASVTVTLTQWDGESFLWNFHLGQAQSLQALPNGTVGVVQPFEAEDELDPLTDEELSETDVTLGECPPGTGDDDDDDGGGGGDDNGDDIGGDDNGDDNGGACHIPDDTDPIGTDPELPPDDEPIEDVVADPNDEEESPETWDGTGESEADYDPDGPFETDPDQDDDPLSLLAGSRESAPGELVAVASVRSATDATGQPVGATLDNGGLLTVFHQRGGYAYPVVVRISLIEDGDLVTNEAASEASFSAAETCTEKNRAKIVTWNPRGWERLANAFADFPATCSRYYISIPLLDGDKTRLRPDRAQRVHALSLEPKPTARNARFTALAEFHWSAWGLSTPNPNPGAYDAGREFRKRMFEAGYRAENGDGWVVQELPSAVRHNPTYRKRALRLLKGLYEGHPIEGPPEVRQKAPGVVLMANFGHRAERLGQYKTNLKGMSSETAFWNAVDKYTTFWAQETYTDCIKACQPRRTVNAKAKRVNAFIQHPARLVFAPDAPLGNPSVRRVRQYFDSSYLPLMNGFWRSDAYRTESYPLDRMSRLVSLQVYAARAWKQTHPYPDKRIGFAWNNNAGITGDTPREDRPERIKKIETLAKRIARAIEGAYSIGGTARRACSPTGRVAPGCSPTDPRGVLDDLYETFARWSQD